MELQTDRAEPRAGPLPRSPSRCCRGRPRRGTREAWPPLAPLAGRQAEADGPEGPKQTTGLPNPAPPGGHVIDRGGVFPACAGLNRREPKHPVSLSPGRPKKRQGSARLGKPASSRQPRPSWPGRQPPMDGLPRGMAIPYRRAKGPRQPRPCVGAARPSRRRRGHREPAAPGRYGTPPPPPHA